MKQIIIKELNTLKEFMNNFDITNCYDYDNLIVYKNRLNAILNILINQQNSSLRFKKGRKLRCVETGKIFDSMQIASKSVGLKTTSSISASLHNRGIKAGGFSWEVVSEEELMEEEEALIDLRDI